MRILVYGLNFWPELTGIGKYTGEMVSQLVTRGHEVRVVTAPPYYPDWEVKHGYSSWRYSFEVVHGAHVTRCPLWVPTRPTGLRRILHLASFAVSSGFKLILEARWRPDVVMLVVPTLFCAPAAWLAARLCGARTWLHIQDFELDAAVGLGLLNKSYLRSSAERFERFWLRRFDRVSTISESMLNRLELKGVTLNRRILFPNWVDTRVIYPLEKPSRFRAELEISPDTTVVLYAGAMGEKQGLEIVIEAARQLVGQSRLKFVLAGAGSARKRLELKSVDLANVVWLPVQPIEKLNELLNLADIHLLPQESGAADLVMPSKLTGMLASGRPVVATAMPGTQLEKLVSKYGVVTPPGDVSRFVTAISNLISDSKRREELGKKARQYACSELDSAVTISHFEQQLTCISG